MPQTLNWGQEDFQLSKCRAVVRTQLGQTIPIIQPSNHSKQKHEEEKGPGIQSVQVVRWKKELRENPDARVGCGTVWGMEMSTDLHRTSSLPSSPEKREGGRPGAQGCRGRAGTGHPSQGPSLPGSPHSLQEGRGHSQAQKCVLRGQDRSRSTGGLLREEAVRSQANIHIGQGLGVYPLTSLLPLPTLIAPGAWIPSVAVFTGEGWREHGEGAHAGLGSQEEGESTPE